MYLIKKTGKITILIILIVVIIFVIHYFFIYVRGTEISELIINGKDNIIQIEKTYETSEKSDVLKKMTLNEEQKDRLISLINDTKFGKIYSGAVPYTDKERFLITLTTADGKILLRMESYGGEFIIIDSSSGDSPSKHWRLKIRNDNWKQTLEDILR